MENNATLSFGSTCFSSRSAAQGWQSAKLSFDIRKSLRSVAAKAMTPVVKLRDYYSSVCGKKLSMSQVALLVNTQVAFLAVAFPADMPMVGRIVCCTWLVASLAKCKQSI